VTSHVLWPGMIATATTSSLVLTDLAFVNQSRMPPR
jgi:hypothetical protein